MQDIETKKMVIFDLDNTLALSKSSLDEEMTILLSQLLHIKKVAVISGGAFPQFESQFLKSFGQNTSNFTNLILLPTSGTKLYIWKGNWELQYSEEMTEDERKNIINEIDKAVKATGILPEGKSYGQTIEDRGSQITFSALGQNAPLHLKETFDPDRTKREKVSAILKTRLPEYDIRLGGISSIDVTKKGVNKGYGIRKLEEFFSIPIDQMVFVGDAIYPGGNDYPAKATGVDCIQVSGPQESKKYIDFWVNKPRKA